MVRVDSKMDKEIRALARMEEKTRSEFIREALHFYMEGGGDHKQS